VSELLTLDPAAMTKAERYYTLAALLVPRPIAWITTRSMAGVVNAAPFSFYAGISANPPILGVGVGRRRDGSRKDTAANALATGEFVVHLAEDDILEELVASSAEYPPEVSEPAALGLALAPSARVEVPALACARARMECRLHRHLEVGEDPVDLLLGEVLAFRVAPELVAADGRIREELLRPVGRLGGQDYAPIRDRLRIPRPPRPESRRN